MPGIVFTRRRRIRAEMHSVPLGAFEQVNVLKRIGARSKRL
jgi:hypothetical protein